MKLTKKLNSIGMTALCAAALFSAGALKAADAKTYQVTGPVLAVTPTTITVQKGDDKWEIARSNKTKITAIQKLAPR
jgi:LysM repeat protein